MQSGFRLAGPESPVMKDPSVQSLTPPLSAPPHPQPESLLDLYIEFSLLALQGFGGVMAIAQREIVERKRWMTRQEFLEEWSVAQVMPGPNIVNLAVMLGARRFGVPGALTAIAGMLSIPLVLVLVVALVYARFAAHPQVVGAMRGLGAVVAGLIVSTALKLASALKNNPLGVPLCIALGLPCFIGVALFRWPTTYLLLGLGAVGCLLAYRKLKP